MALNINKNKKRIPVFSAAVLLFAAAVPLLYGYNIIPHKRYTDADFGFETYISAVDKDNDGIDDQTDILNNAKNYISERPRYKSKYYETGYPNDGYGVCTDVVAFALRDAGYDLMEAVNADICEHAEDYGIETADKNIDFRRVKNLDVYFKNSAVSLTTDLSRTEEWQGGDIVVFKHHIGVISDSRNKKGIPFLIHHANPLQFNYEEDVLERYEDDITGHYRIG